MYYQQHATHTHTQLTNFVSRLKYKLGINMSRTCWCVVCECANTKVVKKKLDEVKSPPVDKAKSAIVLQSCNTFWGLDEFQAWTSQSNVDDGCESPEPLVQSCSSASGSSGADKEMAKPK